MFILAARSAGRNPPVNPMMREKAGDFQAMPAVRVKLKASSAKACQFMVETVINCRKDARKRPMPPPLRRYN